MKPLIVAALVFLAGLAGCSRGNSSTPAVASAKSTFEAELLQQLEAGDVTALEDVLQASHEHSALVLLNGAGVAYEQQRLEDSAFLFFASRLRAAFDRKCFPPVETGGNDPFLPYAVGTQSYASVVLPAVMLRRCSLLALRARMAINPKIWPGQ